MLFRTKVLKLCEGAIAHVSTVTGGYPIGNEEGATSAMDEPDSNNGSGGPGAGVTTYVVVAGEDGAVRFYDLKFRLEVSTGERPARGGRPHVLLRRRILETVGMHGV